MHLRTKSSQPVLPAALRELVSMEMILPGRREREAQIGPMSHLRRAAVAGAHEEILQKEVEVQGVCSGPGTNLHAHLGQAKGTQNPPRSTFAQRFPRCSRPRVPTLTPSASATCCQPPCSLPRVLQVGPATCFIPRHETPSSFAGCFTAGGSSEHRKYPLQIFRLQGSPG